MKETTKAAKKLKRCFDIFQDCLIEQANNKFTLTNIEFRDDNYISSEHIENSYVCFDIEEIPNWDFSIWWNMNKPEDTIIEGSFFAEPKEICISDPSEAGNLETFYIDLNDLEYSSLICVINLLKYIQEEPELAFCRDVYYLDYSTQYVTRRTAKKLYKNWVKSYKQEEKQQEKCATLLLNWAIRTFKEEIEQGKCIILKEWDTYNIQMIASRGVPTGCYDLTEEEMKSYNKISKKCSKVYQNYIDVLPPCVYLFKKKEYDRIMKKLVCIDEKLHIYQNKAQIDWED